MYLYKLDISLQQHILFLFYFNELIGPDFTLIPHVYSN